MPSVLVRPRRIIAIGWLLRPRLVAPGSWATSPSAPCGEVLTVTHCSSSTAIRVFPPPGPALCLCVRNRRPLPSSGNVFVHTRVCVCVVHLHESRIMNYDRASCILHLLMLCFFLLLPRQITDDRQASIALGARCTLDHHGRFFLPSSFFPLPSSFFLQDARRRAADGRPRSLYLPYLTNERSPECTQRRRTRVHTAHGTQYHTVCSSRLDLCQR